MKTQFADVKDDLAAGLIGAGSDCFGFDDEISRDHDWGPGFLIFIPGMLFDEVEHDIVAWYNRLPKTFVGYGPRRITENGRVGPVHLENFFAMYTGFRSQTPTLRQWLTANTESLALTANGEVFYDPSGRLTAWRNSLSHFPEDVRKKKIASDCFLAGQSGQYNYPRSIKRNDTFAANYALIQFCSSALSLAFLFAERFAPYYKWKLKAAMQLPAPYNDIAKGVDSILRTRGENTQNKIEALSAGLIAHLLTQGLTASQSDYLPDHKTLIENTIEDNDIRSLPGLY